MDEWTWRRFRFCGEGIGNWILGGSVEGRRGGRRENRIGTENSRVHRSKVSLK